MFCSTKFFLFCMITLFVLHFCRVMFWITLFNVPCMNNEDNLVTCLFGLFSLFYGACWKVKENAGMACFFSLHSFLCALSFWAVSLKEVLDFYATCLNDEGSRWLEYASFWKGWRQCDQVLHVWNTSPFCVTSLKNIRAVPSPRSPQEY